ncbi:MAG: ATP-binding protein [Candidatus Thiodiazotropha sp.]
MPLSIRRRLLIRLITAMVVCGLIAIGFVYNAAYHEVEEVYDAALAQQSRVLATLMTHESEEEMEVRRNLRQLAAEAGDELISRSPLFRQLLKHYLEKQVKQDYLTLIDQESIPGHRYESKIAFIVIVVTDKVLLRSNMPGSFEEFISGFNERTIGGKLWRTFGLTDPKSKLRVMVGEQHGIRDETLKYIVFNSLWPMFASLPFFALVVWFTVGSGLKPLKQVAVKVERRDPNSLVPISPEAVPYEVVPMVESLNRLFSRVQSALDNERQFTADAAHELRTPLAGLKAVAQAKQLSDPDGEHRAFLEQIIKGVDRTSHLLEQLLTLARMESQSTAMQNLEKVDLPRQVLEVVSEIGQLALERGIDLSYDGEESDVFVKGNGPALQILIRNLIDNAIRYTPIAGRIHIAIVVESQETKLVIEDSGPGIPAEQMNQVFQRFKRGEDVRAEGSGLGLSIVRRILELHSGRIKLENLALDMGLRVSVYLSSAG